MFVFFFSFKRKNEKFFVTTIHMILTYKLLIFFFHLPVSFQFFFFLLENWIFSFSKKNYMQSSSIFLLFTIFFCLLSFINHNQLYFIICWTQFIIIIIYYQFPYYRFEVKKKKCQIYSIELSTLKHGVFSTFFMSAFIYSNIYDNNNYI